MTFTICDWHHNSRVPNAEQHLGRIPLLFNPDCADPAWLQLRDNYPEGWNPEAGGWTLTGDEYLIYPGLPPVAPSAFAYLHDEKLLVYPAGWLVVVQPDGEYTVTRVMP